MNDDEDPEQTCRESDGTFAKGVSGNLLGRPRGARARLGEAFLRDLVENWETHGAATIEEFRTSRPHDYVKLVASLLPRNVSIRVNEYDELTDEQLRQRLHAALARLRAGGFDVGGGPGTPVQTQPLVRLPALPEAG